jgi:ArsR family transcriptional regulator, lead/cadmium/zinc/bismuth-responsive transcriptional repressor
MDRQTCSTTIIHAAIVQKAIKSLPSHEILYDVADFFKIFGDSTRIKILWSLFFSEMCVCDMCAVLSMEQSAVSHQLRILKQSRLVKYRRDGKVVYYSLDDSHVKAIINQALEHVNE